MSWDKIFSTRQGGSIGKSLEGGMLDKVGGPNTIRTEIRMLPDGSEVMLRTRGGHPEFTVTPAKKAIDVVYSNWTWPWHGLSRNGYIETPTGNLVASSYNVGGVGDSFEFRAFKSAASFENIAPPKSGDVSCASWVNWACISRGVLFGRWSGSMNTWLFVQNGVCWVASLVFSSKYAGTIAFYTLANWVESMPVADAPKFVAYDRAPTPFMVPKPPSGALRQAVQTVSFTLPSHYLPSLDFATIAKISDISGDGKKVLFEYEEQLESSAYLVTSASEATGALGTLGRQRLAQWSELVVSFSGGAFSVSTAIIKSDAILSQGVKTVTKSYEASSEAFHDFGHSPLEGEVQSYRNDLEKGPWEHVKTTVTTHSGVSTVLGYVYSSAGELDMVRLDWECTQTDLFSTSVSVFPYEYVGTINTDLSVTSAVVCGGNYLPIVTNYTEVQTTDGSANTFNVDKTTTCSVGGVSETRTSNESAAIDANTAVNLLYYRVSANVYKFSLEPLENSVNTVTVNGGGTASSYLAEYTPVSDFYAFNNIGVSRTTIGLPRFYNFPFGYYMAAYDRLLASSALVHWRLIKVSSDCFALTIRTNEGDTIDVDSYTYEMYRERIVCHFLPTGWIVDNTPTSDSPDARMAINTATGSYTKFLSAGGNYPKYV